MTTGRVAHLLYYKWHQLRFRIVAMPDSEVALELRFRIVATPDLEVATPDSEVYLASGNARSRIVTLLVLPFYIIRQTVQRSCDIWLGC